MRPILGSDIHRMTSYHKTNAERFLEDYRQSRNHLGENHPVTQDNYQSWQFHSRRLHELQQLKFSPIEEQE